MVISSHEETSLPEVKKVCVFCGSSRGAQSVFAEGAKALAETLYQKDITLVYGGASVGLMGELADTLLRLGGKVIGVIPQDLLAKEIAHTGLTELHVVKSLHERKARMAELADAFIMLPGGTGSLEEFFEILTWGQLGLHAKPAGILNIANYFDDLIKFLHHTVTMEFIKPVFVDTIIIKDDPNTLLNAIAHFVPTKEVKWIKSTEHT